MSTFRDLMGLFRQIIRNKNVGLNLMANRLKWLIRAYIDLLIDYLANFEEYQQVKFNNQLVKKFRFCI